MVSYEDERTQNDSLSIDVTAAATAATTAEDFLFLSVCVIVEKK